MPSAQGTLKSEKTTNFKIMIRSVSKILSQSSNADETESDNEILFLINKSGFPLKDQTWEQMWDYAAKMHPAGYDIVNKIRSQQNLPQVPVPQPPLTFNASLSVPEKLKKIQDYMIELQYNHTGTQFFEIRKKRPISGLMECAREMMREALPVKCLEAVILGIFLTNGMLGLERFTLSFKTDFRGDLHRHVVLGITYLGCYGAIGMSRRDDLMYKPVEFKTLAELIFDFERCYKKYWHIVKKVKVGLPITHDQHSYQVITWKALLVNFSKSSKKEMTHELDVYARRMKCLTKSNVVGPCSSIKILSTTELLRESQTYQDESSKACGSKTQKSRMASREKGSSKDALSKSNYQIRV